MATIVRLRAPGGVEQLEITTAELPPPAAGEIRLQQTAIGVNFIDIYQRSGLYPLPGAIPGVEAVGVVTAVGADVTTPKLGDRVAYAGAPIGAYATERNLPAWRAVKLSDGLSDETVASSFVKGITAHMLLRRIYPVEAGTTILVHAAAGGLGQLLTRWANRLGATVIGTVGSEPKAAVARAAGTQHVVVGRGADFVRVVTDVTQGRGVDAAYDGIGGATLQQTLACVRPFGVVASTGQAGGPIPPFDVEELGPRRSLIFARPSVMAYMNDADEYRRAADAVLAALANGDLEGSGTAYRLNNVAQAHADLEAGATCGALYLKP